MNGPPEKSAEIAALNVEIERLRKERNSYREELKTLESRGEDTLSAELRLLSVNLSKEIREDFVSMLRRAGAMIALLVTVATAGGLWTLSDRIHGVTDDAVKTAVAERQKDLAKFRDDMIQSVVEFKFEAKQSLQKIKDDAKQALEAIKSEQENVVKASNEAQRAMVSRVASLADVAPASEVGIISIPVVVHVIYHIPLENISDEQIVSQLTVLNQDYRAKNEDRSKVPDCFKPIVGDAHIEFSLATIDPEGKPTNGITRTRTNRESFESDDSVKFQAKGGANPWPTETYLNVWVCTLEGGLLRYSQFPGGPKATDGVVVNNKAFGTTGTAVAPFNKGRSLVGGIAMYLNLRHIWGDTLDCSGTDFVADTPPQAGPNFGAPSFPHITCKNGPNGDMFMNFLDYVDDGTMLMFTKGQVDRMRETLENQRSKLGKR